MYIIKKKKKMKKACFTGALSILISTAVSTSAMPDFIVRTPKLIDPCDIDERQCLKNLRNKLKPGADLRGADLRNTDLNGANLSGANLSGANLWYSRARNVNLSRANLTNVQMSGANLSGANLSSANLSGVRLAGTNFSNADMTNANLSGASGGGANMAGANLSGANLNGVIIRTLRVCPAFLPSGWVCRVNIHHGSPGAQNELVRGN
tara:strand:- start:63 stop:686 length:624 start_codon:yes stop_codon:yes gene_type:complete